MAAATEQLCEAMWGLLEWLRRGQKSQGVAHSPRDSTSGTGGHASQDDSALGERGTLMLEGRGPASHFHAYREASRSCGVGPGWGGRCVLVSLQGSSWGALGNFQTASWVKSVTWQG